MPTFSTPWPYPRWIAHRGAGKLAPENTLAAFRLGAAHGYRMFECDVKLSSDGVPFLLHDDTLERTSNGQGIAGELPWQQLSQLDAGGWHSPGFAGEPLATLGALATFCRANDLLVNLEIKPSPGTARHTGQMVAQHAMRLWQGAAIPPLLTSFEVDALEGAVAAHTGLPCGLLCDTLWDGWLATARRLQCVAVVCNYRLWTQAHVDAVHAAGMRALSYTVNEEAAAQQLIAFGTDGLITDRVDFFNPANP